MSKNDLMMLENYPILTIFAYKVGCPKRLIKKVAQGYQRTIRPRMVLKDLYYDDTKRKKPHQFHGSVKKTALAHRL